MRKTAPLLLCCFLIVACSRPEHDQAAAAQQADQPAPEAASEQAVQSSPVVELTAAQIVTPELSGACNLESIDDVVVPDANPIELKSKQFKVAGWVVDEVSRRVPTEVQLRIASQSGNGRVWQQTLIPANERPDVQQNQGGSADTLKSGFSGSIDASTLDAGTYALRLAYVRDGKEIVCDNGRKIVLD